MPCDTSKGMERENICTKNSFLGKKGNARNKTNYEGVLCYIYLMPIGIADIMI